MAKVETVKSYDFKTGEWKKPGEKRKSIVNALAATAPALVFVLPKVAFAAGVNGAFGNIHEAIMNGFDAGVVIVIIFAGAAWGLGHRPKAIEILIGVCIGYILARHAVDIRDFLKGI